MHTEGTSVFFLFVCFGWSTLKTDITHFYQSPYVF